MKRIISALLAVIMLFSVCTFASSSLTSKVVSAEICESNKYRPVTRQMIRGVIKFYDEIGMLDELKKDGKIYFNDWFDVDVTFADGEKVTVKDEDISVTLKDRCELSVRNYVDYNEYMNAKKNSKNKINVYLECVTGKVDNIWDAIFGSEKIEPFKVTRKLIKGPYIKSVQPVSKIPDLKYQWQEVVDLSGVKFKVEYYNGKVKTYKAKKEYDRDNVTADVHYNGFYTIGGEPIGYGVNKKSVWFYWLDAATKQKVELKKFPFKSIRINDYSIDNGNLASITYTITKINNTSRTYTCNDKDLLGEFEPIQTINGFDVYTYAYEDGDMGSVSISLFDLDDEVVYDVKDNNGSSLNIFTKVLSKIISTIFALFIARKV